MRPISTPIVSVSQTSPTVINVSLLIPFEFDVATIDTQNQINSQRQQAQYLAEDLGNGVILKMVAIPGGEFWMGSPYPEKERLDSETPWHKVRSSPFFMAQTQITQAQWKAVAALPQINQSLFPDPSSYFKGATLPVEEVSWYDAVEFCARLSRKTGKNYRLPSEAEWEYACRAGTTTPFHFGETITPELANYNYGSGPKGKYHLETTPVGSFQVANPFGLYDMHGNVWEWCADHWHNNYIGAPADGTIWLSSDESSYRLLRGGSWYCNSEQCRSAYRSYNSPDIDNHISGFRVVCASTWTL